MTDTANGIELKYDDMWKIKYMVHHVYDLIDLHGGAQLAIYDCQDSMIRMHLIQTQVTSHIFL